MFSKNYIKNLINDKEWEDIKYIKYNYVGRGYDFGLQRPRNLYERYLELYTTFNEFLKKRRLERIAESVQYAKSVVLGNYREGSNAGLRHLVNRLGYEEIYIVDDGTDSILINEERKRSYIKDNSSNDANQSFLKQIKSWIRKEYLQLNTEPAREVTFFTCYDIITKPEDRLINNNYEYLRSLASEKEIINEVLFLGQCLVDDGYLTADIYISYLRAIKKYFMAANFIYIPHPRESNKIIDLIQKSLKITIRRLHVPIEYEVSIRGNRPKYLISFFSSALESCSKILSESTEIKAFYLYPEHLMAAKDNVSKVYDYYSGKADERIEVVML